MQLSDPSEQLKEKTPAPAPAETKQWSVCPVHPQVPPLFCMDECRCICAVCEFSDHKDHEVLSEKEAERRLKEPLRSQLQTLKQHRQNCEELQQEYDQIQIQSEEQGLHCESQITAVFDMMQRHLQEQQDKAVRALRKEQDRQGHLLMSQRKTLKDKLSSVNKSIQQLETHLQTQTQDFLLMPRPPAGPLEPPLPTGLRQDQEKPSTPTGLEQDLEKPSPPTGLMLDQAKLLGNLGFRVWRSLRRAVQHTPVLLDPNTANRWLHVSEDLSRVRREDTYQDHLPDVPERFSKYTSVLGSEGFRSGTHQWDVEVGDHPDWIIGVAKESVDKTGETFASPEFGIWGLCHGDGGYSNGDDEPVAVAKSPEKIRVKLDYGRGTVSFYNADHMTHLYVYTHTFTEKMFPYFYIGESEEAKTKEIHICETLDV
uniref:B30.2/SPRY domain-containing protein n=1 Tax=Knipowitschia caucasica TaxID=637954 RepID=A0AAV2MMA1_KNICA